MKLKLYIKLFRKGNIPLIKKLQFVSVRIYSVISFHVFKKFSRTRPGSALAPRDPAGSEPPGRQQQEHTAGQSRHRPGPAGDGGNRR